MLNGRRRLPDRLPVEDNQEQAADLCQADLPQIGFFDAIEVARYRRSMQHEKSGHHLLLGTYSQCPVCVILPLQMTSRATGTGHWP